MINLFKTEFVRYRNPALLAALVHLALMAVLGAVGADLNTVPAFAMWWLGCMVAAASFGILQMNSHKRINHWVYLLQRPLAPWKIATAIAGAGCAAVLIALVAPFVFNLARLQLTQAQGIELRHYLLLGQIMPALLLVYIYACFSALYTHKFKFIGFTVFLGVIANLVSANVYAVLSMLALVTVVCFYTWFKPDLGKGATSPLFIILSELPLHFGLFWLALNIHTVLLQVGWSVFQNGPASDPAPSSVAALERKDGREIMLAALEGGASAEVAFYRQQIELGEVVLVPGPNERSFPARNQRPSLDNKLLLTDPATNATWRFSHTAMLFKGVDAQSDAVLGWLGPQGFVSAATEDTARFASVPWVTQNHFILDDATIYQLDWEQRTLREKFSLIGLDQPSNATEPERFSDSLGIQGNIVTLLSNRNLYLFRSRQFNDFAETPVLETRLPLPLPDRIGRSRLHVMELINGYLVADLVGVNLNLVEGKFFTFDRTGLFLYETGVSKSNTLLNSRALSSGYGSSVIYEGFVLAPGFRLLSDLVSRVTLGWHKESALPLRYHHFPPVVLLLALCSMLVSGAVVNHLLKPVALPRAAKLTWVALAAFSGWFGLASFYLGTYRGALSMQIKLGNSHGHLPVKTEAGNA